MFSSMIPGYIQTVAALLQEIYDPTGCPMNKVMPIPRFPMSPLLWSLYPSIPPVPETLTHWLYPSDPSVQISSRSTRKTQIMATLNVTPNSFSDRAKYGTLPAVLHYVSSSFSTLERPLTWRSPSPSRTSSRPMSATFPASSSARTGCAQPRKRVKARRFTKLSEP